MKLIKKIKKKLTKKIPVYIQVEQNNILNNRVAFITGGTGGIGKALVKAFLDSGCYVIFTGRDFSKIKIIEDEFSDYNSKLKGYVLDADNIEAYSNVFYELEKDISLKIDILVNNIGIVSKEFFPNITVSDFDNVMNTNVKCMLFLSEYFTKYMIDNKVHGNILNIGSSSALRPAISSYMLSKWCVRGLTAGMGKSLIKYGIVVNGINPGPTNTSMITNDCDNLNKGSNDAKRLVTTSEIANMAIRLVSNECRMIIGEMVNITGGSGTLTFDDIKY